MIVVLNNLTQGVIHTIDTGKDFVDFWDEGHPKGLCQLELHAYAAFDIKRGDVIQYDGKFFRKIFFTSQLKEFVLLEEIPVLDAIDRLERQRKRNAKHGNC